MATTHTQTEDTTLLGYSNKFCDRISNSWIWGRGSSSDILLNAEPKNTKEELILFSATPLIFLEYDYWKFHLLPKSKIILTACRQFGDRAATFFLVKGVRNFGRWVHDKSSHYEKSFKVETYCSSSGSNNEKVYEYTVHFDDQYYIIYSNEHSYSTLQLTFNITKRLYTVSSDIVADNCSVSLTFYPVAYSSNQSKPLLQLEPKYKSTTAWKANGRYELPCTCLALHSNMPVRSS